MRQKTSTHEKNHALFWLVGASTVQLLVFIALVVLMIVQINEFKAVVEKSTNLHDWEGQIRWLDEVLTMSARMAVLTGNTSWVCLTHPSALTGSMRLMKYLKPRIPPDCPLWTVSNPFPSAILPLRKLRHRRFGTMELGSSISLGAGDDVWIERAEFMGVHNRAIRTFLEDDGGHAWLLRARCTG